MDLFEEFGEHKDEMDQHLFNELYSLKNADDLKSGHDKDTMLIRALAQDLSVDSYLQMNRFQMGRYKYLSALSAASAELKGIALLHLVSAIEGNKLMITVGIRAGRTLAYFDYLEKRFSRFGGGDILMSELRMMAIEKAMFVVNSYWADIERIGARRYE